MDITDVLYGLMIAVVAANLLVFLFWGVSAAVQMSQRKQSKITNDTNGSNGRKLAFAGWERSDLLRYLKIMTALTGVYLIVELAFNARLLDVVGGMASEEEIDRIELFGRVISGVALMLAVWGMWVFPRYYRTLKPLRSKAELIALLLVTGILSIGAMYKAQDLIIQSIVDNSTAEQRYTAARLLLLTDAAHQHKIDIANIDLSPDVIGSPAGQSFLALLPMMGLTVNDLEERTDSATEQIVRSLIVDQKGGPQEYFNEVYLPSLREVTELYNEYSKASNPLVDVLANSGEEQRKAWDQFVETLSESGYTPGSVPRQRHSRIRNDLLRKDIRISSSWHPTDQSSFYEAVGEKVHREALDEFRSRILKIPEYQYVGGVIPEPGLTRNEFFRHSGIQNKWKRDIGLASPDVVLLTYNYDQMRDLVWEPSIENAVEERMKLYSANILEFSDGGLYQYDGERAMKALAVPPVALFFSLIGALVHIFKLSNYGLALIFPSWSWRQKVVGAVCLLLAVAPFTQQNEITQSSLYESFHQDVGTTFSPVTSGFLTWIIQAQPYAYPINEAIRIYVLAGYSFGYDGDSSLKDE